MFVLMWTVLLFSARGTNADAGAVTERKECRGEFCITLNDGVITAEAGLCALIPCSFTSAYFFTPWNMVWFKQPRIIIIHSTNRDRDVPPEFRGRVSLLQPDVSLRNCSIIINDLRESDSGSYQLRLNGLNSFRADGLNFPLTADVSVTALKQRPTVTVPPLVEGQQTSLTCTAPGLCSGSDPTITWTWRKPGEDGSRVLENIPALWTEDVTAVSRRHSSALTFNLSSEHHGTEITCKVGFANGVTTEETVTLNVTYLKEAEITGNTNVTEGETLNLTCAVESFPPSRITWTKPSDKFPPTGSETDPQSERNDTERPLQAAGGTNVLYISNTTAEDSGLYVCTVTHLNNTVKKDVDVTVMYMRTPVIAGRASLEFGDSLNLTCSVDSFPPSRIAWSGLGSSAAAELDSGSATLVIHNVTMQHSGRYVCAAQYLDAAVTVFADVAVTLFPKIFEDSGCVVQSGVLTCACVGEGFPLPAVTWPLLRNRTDYSVTSRVSHHAVSSVLSLAAEELGGSVECVSSNENGEAKENLTVQIDESKQPTKGGVADELSKLLKASHLEVVGAFLMGVLLSAVIFCLVAKYHRTKQKSSGNLDETLEMVTSQEDPLIDAGQQVEDNHTDYQHAAAGGGGGGGGGAVATEKAALGYDVAPKDVEYADIDFSKLKRKARQEAANKQEATATEYAEIKREEKGDGEVNDGLEGEMEEEEEEEEVMMGFDEEMNPSVPADGEDRELYSNLKEMMGDI